MNNKTNDCDADSTWDTIYSMRTHNTCLSPRDIAYKEIDKLNGRIKELEKRESTLTFTIAKSKTPTEITVSSNKVDEYVVYVDGKELFTKLRDKDE